MVQKGPPMGTIPNIDPAAGAELITLQEGSDENF
jgi:hypothetical protein